MIKTANPNKLYLIIIAITLAVNNIFIGYKIMGISFDRILLGVLFVISLKSFLYDIKTNKYLRLVVIFFIIFFALNLLKSSYLVLACDEYNISNMIRSSFRILTMLIFFYLSFFLISRSSNYRLFKYMLFILFLAFLLAFFQSYLTPFTEIANKIINFFFSVNMDENMSELIASNIEYGSTWELRTTGPYGSTITLSYALASAGLLSTYLYKKTEEKIYIYMLLFILVVAVLSMTRSVIITQIILVFYSMFSVKNRLGKLVITLAILIMPYLFYLYLDSFERVLDLNETSASGKIPLIITAIYALLLSPLGVCSTIYEEARHFMYEIFHTEEILKYTAHNGIVNIGFEYTVIGYLLFFYFFYLLFKASKKLRKSDRKLWVALIVAYFFQQSFHNMGLFVGDFPVLLILALYIFDISLSKNYKNRSVSGG
ncbi:MAG: hypothetical protein P794_05240 [Epsilonproteobacteria bacterium (ex Lamellibrachia satsuma)]|nr:MAG: hypothetical protein P794_05240 [Epsilonproteobacteria bacterium (ex Lamellibrachia satsuma)]